MQHPIEKNILILGDSCRDIFVYCTSDRLCPEAPVPALKVSYKIENGGMAKNVFNNLRSFMKGVDIVTNKNWYDNTKIRYVHEATNHMFFRVDNDIKIDRINKKDIDLNYKIIVISDYNKGFLQEEDIDYICTNHSNVFLDTKKIIGSWANNAKFIKINNFEYENSKKFLTELLYKKIIHTKGSEGCIFQDKKYPVKKVEVKDSSGAGDSFMAGLVYKYFITNNIYNSINFANSCAEKAVQHRGVTAISQVDLAAE
jgi:bifunctional ADP-heptose synthase (sugar kinase/adenylyltransferase)